MTIMVAYANTTEGRVALRHGRELASREGAELVVFDLSRSSGADDRTVDPVPDSPPGRWLAAARGALSPAEDLLDTARQLGVSLIIVGVRRRSSVGKLLLGSNAQTIILGADVPVLCVKGGPA